jgi:hypothetical protein
MYFYKLGPPILKFIKIGVIGVLVGLSDSIIDSLKGSFTELQSIRQGLQVTIGEIDFPFRFFSFSDLVQINNLLLGKLDVLERVLRGGRAGRHRNATNSVGKVAIHGEPDKY